jgi:hypothetical protein
LGEGLSADGADGKERRTKASTDYTARRSRNQNEKAFP